MPLLPFSACDPSPPEHNCGFLYDTAEALLAAAADGLDPFLPPADCDTFDTYVSMNAPVAEFYDALSIHLVRYGATNSAANMGNLAACNPGVYPQQRADWTIRLWENQYPAAEETDEQIVVPSPDRLSAVNEWLYAHGIAIYNAVVAGAVAGSLGLPPQVSKVLVGDLTPLGPQGASAGWSFNVTTVIG